MEVQLPDDALPDSEYVLTHLVYVISSLLGSGRNPVSFPVLCRQYAYQTCQPSLERLSVTKTSARSPLSQNQNKSPRQVRLLLGVRYHPLMLVTPHSSRQSQTAFSPRLSEPTSNFCSVSTTPYLTLSSQVSIDPQALTKLQGGKTFCASFCASLIAGSRRAFLCVDCVCLLLVC